MATAALAQPTTTGSLQTASLAVSILFLGTAAVSFWGFVAQGAFKYLIVTGFLIHLFVECRLYLARQDGFGLLSPVFLSSLTHFYLCCLLPTTATLFDPWIQERFVEYMRSPDDDIEKTVAMTWVGAFCLWRGYYYALGSARGAQRALSRVQSLRKQFTPHVPAAIAIQVGYFALVTYAVSLGVFGYASSAEARNANLALFDLLNLGLAAGSLSFLLLMADLFRRWQAGVSAPLLTAVCVGVVVMHLGVGALSGFKSQLVMPFVMIAAANFLVTHRINWKAVAGGLAALLVAYQVIEPYREYLNRNQLSGQSDAGSLVEALQKAQNEQEFRESEISRASFILQRFDLTAMAAIGIAFVDWNPVGNEYGRELAETIYLAPILAFVPRALWSEKKSYDTGSWFNRVVLGNSYENAVAMGPTAWFYFVGGWLGVGIGFFAFGIAQAFYFEALARSGAGGTIIFLSAANSLVMIPTDVGPVLVGMLRLFPIAFVAQWVLLKPTTPSMQR